MNIDVLIIGQGLSGTFLTRELERRGVSFLVIDEAKPFTASRVAAGLINPVTGKRLVKTWLIDELLPFAQQAYRSAEEALSIKCLTTTSVVDFFPGPEAREAFGNRYAQDSTYLERPEDETAWNASFLYDFGYGLIRPCYLADVQTLLTATRTRLKERDCLLEERWEPADLRMDTTGIAYRDIRADRIVLCDGVEAAGLPWFSLLPFAPNKGEVLIVDIPEMTGLTVFKKDLSLIPLPGGLWWVGSSYEWDFRDALPSEAFRARTEARLKAWLKMSYKVIDHFAAIRPATLERQPFVGFHPVYPRIGLLNGMGMKGCSLAPYFAHQLAAHLFDASPILPQADLRRFSGILSRTAH
jgi:glycine/D-amino acid oxidase-like deaminating enzyme